MRRFFVSGILGLVCILDSASLVRADGGAGLIRQMRATGKPALIVAGNESCVYCRQMAAELAGNQDLQPLVRQFFVLKVDTDSSDWPLLQQAFQFGKSGIPAVFIVRGDGKLLYSESGKPRDMGAFLQKQLDSAGAILSAEQLRELQTAVRNTRAAIKRHRLGEAVALINQYGNTGSYAAVAMEISQLKEGLVSQAIGESNKAAARIENDKEPVDAAMALVALRRDFAELPTAKEHVEGVWSKLAEGERFKDLMRHAEQLESAATLQKEKKYDEALAIYKQIAGASADSTAGAYAQAEIPSVERRLAARAVDSGGSADDTASISDDSAPGGSSELDAKRAASYLKLAKVFREKKPEKAREYLQKAIEAAPESAEAEEAQQLLDGLE